MKPEIDLRAVGVHFRVYYSSTRSFSSRVLSWGGPSFGRLAAPRPTEMAVLTDISVHLHGGDRVAVLGANGAGKSTLVRVLGGLLKPTSGDVLRRGRAASVMDAGFGVDPEATVRENLLVMGLAEGFDLKDARRMVERTLQSLEGDPDGQRPLSDLSQVEVLKLGIARSLATGAPILCFDEVLGAMGDDFLAWLASELDQRGDSALVVVVERSRELLERLCDKALVLDRGHLVDFGALDIVLRASDENLTG